MYSTCADSIIQSEVCFIAIFCAFNVLHQNETE